MKRQLSLVLALVMILGSFSSVFAAVSVDQSAVNVAGKFLKAEGVLEGDDGDLMLDANLKRRDAVVLISRLLGEEEEAKVFPSEDLKFTDLTDDYYNGYIAWSVAKEIIEGHTGTTLFGFNEEITSQDFATVVLRVLGYTVDEAAYPKALELAEELGLLIDIEGVENKTVVTRGMMALMTLNAMYVEVKGEKVTLAEKLGIKNLPVREEEAATELSAKVLDTENLAEVVVELSNVDLVKNKEALTTPSNYRINIDDVKVYNVDVDGDNVILTLTPYGNVEDYPNFNDSLIKGKKFDLTIRNIDSRINKTYKGILANDNAIPAVENVEFMGDYGIKVTTSEPIFNPLERNFRLDTRTSMIVEQYGRDIILTPYHGGAFDKDANQLTVDKLEDFAGYMSATTFEDMKLSTDDALPQVEAVYRSGDKLTVVFDRDIYHDSIEAYKNRRDTGNVSFVERRVTFYAETAKKVDTNVAVYTFEREIPRGIEVEISGVTNHFNKAMETVVKPTVDYKDDYAPTIVTSTKDVKVTVGDNTRINSLVTGLTKAKDIDAKLDEKTAGVVNRIVDTQEMTITFDKDIAEFKVSNETKAQVIARLQGNLDRYFTLYELDVTRRSEVRDVNLIVSDIKDDQIKLKFEDIKVNNSTRDFDYVLEVKDFTDLNRNRMDREYLDFQVVRIDDAFSVVIEGVYPERYYNRGGAEIRLVFNDFVNKVEASNAKNYYLDGKLKVNEAIVERDGKTVSLVLYDTTPAKVIADYEILEISPRVQSLDDDLLAHRFFYVDNTRGQATDPSKVAGDIKALAKAIEAAEEAITELPGTITLGEKGDVEAARVLVNKVKALDSTAVVSNEATLVAAELAIAKIVAKAELDEYVDVVDYVMNNGAAVVGAISAGKGAIDLATDTDGVDTALASAKSAIDAIKTDVEEADAADLILVNAAKSAIEALTDTQIVLASGDDEVAAKGKVEAVVDALPAVVAIDSATVTQTGFLADVSGSTAGHYKFTVTLVKGTQTVTTSEVTITIPNS